MTLPPHSREVSGPQKQLPNLVREHWLLFREVWERSECLSSPQPGTGWEAFGIINMAVLLLSERIEPQPEFCQDTSLITEKKKMTTSQVLELFLCSVKYAQGLQG